MPCFDAANLKIEGFQYIFHKDPNPIDGGKLIIDTQPTEGYFTGHRENYPGDTFTGRCLRLPPIIIPPCPPQPPPPPITLMNVSFVLRMGNFVYFFAGTFVDNDGSGSFIVISKILGGNPVVPALTDPPPPEVGDTGTWGGTKT